MLVNFQVQRVIAHQVFARDPDRRVISPRCSTGLTRLEPSGRLALQERLVSALGDNSHAVEMSVSKAETGSTFQKAARCIEGSDAVFTASSRDLAVALADAQSSRTIPGGVVLITSGISGRDGRRFVAVVKAETDDGFVSKTVGEEVSFEFLPSLFMTAQQKLYKIGFFLETKRMLATGDRMRDPADFLVLVYDHNMTAKETQGAALYFYEAFLGCCATPSSAALTRDFYFKSKKFIDTTSLIPDADKLDAHGALYTYLKVDQRHTLSASEFASRYLSGKVRDAYRTHMREEEFPTTAVNKDLSYLARVLRRRRHTFTSEVSISGPAERFAELVKIMPDDGSDHTLVRIAGRLSHTD